MNEYERSAREMVHEWESLENTVTAYDTYIFHNFRKIHPDSWITITFQQYLQFLTINCKLFLFLLFFPLFFFFFFIKSSIPFFS